MLMAVNEPYALMVQPDDILISPREVDEHFGTMVCFHPRYALGDHHNYMDKDDFLREMYLDTVGHDEAGMKRYERMVNIVSSRFRHGPKTEERAIDEAMQKVISEKYLMLPLYLYDHSGLAMSTESFSGRAPHAEWDSGQVGWIYVSKEDALKEFDSDKMTGAIRQKAEDEIAVLLKERQKLYRYQPNSPQIDVLTEQLKKLRHTAKLCRNIETHSIEMEQCLQAAQQEEQQRQEKQTQEEKNKQTRNRENQKRR